MKSAEMHLENKPRKKLTELLGIDYPILVAPMFLVSTTQMVIGALEAGATAAIPALNFRTDVELRKAISDIKSATDKPFGINLIVNKSNPSYKSQLKTLLEVKVAFIITSLGSPEETIKQCKPLGIKVFCDVVDATYAQKLEALGADALIAVNNRAGGHAGPISQASLLSTLLGACKLPILSAGGIASGQQINEALELGASGVSIGTIFIASDEASVSEDYKNALIQYGEKDIVCTDKLSGSKLTVINTPYVQQMGTKASWLERVLLTNKWLKKYVKMWIAYRGMKQIENAAFKATYKTVWCAGPSIEQIHSIRPMKAILGELIEGMKDFS